MTTKKAAASASKGRAKAAKRKSRKNPELKPRQKKLLQGIVEGKSVRAAALEAGYSIHTANSPADLLSTDAMRAALQRRLSLDKIIQRIDEGMDAEIVNTIVLGRKGKEKLHISTAPNYFERRSAAALAAKLIGADPASRLEVHGDVNTLVKVEFIDVAASAQP